MKPEESNNDGMLHGHGPMDELKQGVWSPRLIGLREFAEAIGKTLDWDEDWMPVLFAETDKIPAGTPGVPPDNIGKPGMIGVGLAGDCLKELIIAVALKLRAKGLTFLMTVWMSAVKDENPEPVPENETKEEARARAYAWAREHRRKHGTPSEDPNRIEKLMLISIYNGGEDDGFKHAFADIKREKGKPPVLHDWMLFDDPDLNAFGRFADAMDMGLKLSQEIREEEGQ